ncbi:MAG: hypothetical protein WKG32_07790 [Gemmatimonadaceae bacterium]
MSLKARTRGAMLVLVCAAAIPAAGASAQRTPPRRGQTIEIRGQVPTPQVVTVRPRETPVFSRQVLVPAFYDRSFWPSLLPGYQLVLLRDITGGAAADSVAPPVASTATPAVGTQALTAPAPLLQPATPRPVVTPQPVGPSTMARDEELRIIRRELELRRARLDSLDRVRRARLDSLEARARREMRNPPPPDTTRRPPGTPSALSRRPTVG